MKSAYVLCCIAASEVLPDGHTLGHLVTLTGLIEHLGDGIYQPTPAGWAAIERLGRESLAS